MSLLFTNPERHDDVEEFNFAKPMNVGDILTTLNHLFIYLAAENEWSAYFVSQKSSRKSVDSGKDRNRIKITQLMTAVPAVRTVVLVTTGSVFKDWMEASKGENGTLASISTRSTIAVLRWNPYQRKAEYIQGPDPLSKPDGEIRLWGSDFLSEDDNNLGEEFQGPHPKQAAFDKPNITIPYGTILTALQSLARGWHTHPGPMPSRANDKPSNVGPRVAGLNGPNVRHKHVSPKMLQSARDKFKKSKRHFSNSPCFKGPATGGGLPAAAPQAARFGRVAARGLGCLFRK